MAIKLAIANDKGGVGKTTTTVTLANCFALHGRRVLIVDGDPQGQCSTALGLPSEPGLFRAISSMIAGTNDDIHQWIRLTGRNNLDLLPGNETTAAAQILLAAQNKPIDSLWAMLSPLRKEYDYILFDTAPSVGGIKEGITYAADFVLIPSATEYLSLDGLTLTMSLLAKMRETHNWQGALMGILPTFYDESTAVSKESLEQLKQSFGREVLSTIHRATALRECVAEGKTIFEYAPTHRASQEYEAVTAEIFRRS
ncbi:MAG: ParA family protein [Anaerolineae bacterium]|nr:ParA family protein [Anaerolineae bacterium]